MVMLKGAADGVPKDQSNEKSLASLVCWSVNQSSALAVEHEMSLCASFKRSSSAGSPQHVDQHDHNDE